MLHSIFVWPAAGIASNSSPSPPPGAVPNPRQLQVQLRAHLQVASIHVANAQAAPRATISTFLSASRTWSTHLPAASAVLVFIPHGGAVRSSRWVSSFCGILLLPSPQGLGERCLTCPSELTEHNTTRRTKPRELTRVGFFGLRFLSRFHILG
jgi:hypothetical protein